MTDWNVPPPPRRPSEPIRGRRVAAGIGIALAAHAATLLLLLAGLLFRDEDFAVGPGLIALLVGQLAVFLGCLTVGIVRTVRQDGGVGVGLLIGWAIGLLVAPVAGFGICVWAFSTAGSI
jgi:hypothetical protein